ncbi:sugar phosphate nucleotidyltransferase [Paenibacillus sp. GCM10027629]|uniref:sugar phosphate nucleotidyltransferase n=1 Tax=Paenibacillus sp. GCM10027629 TaxID=3273414 RepID=UPI0036367890
MKAVIMAGGKGTRLRPLTMQTPKPMVPLLNRPCMEYIIELLKKHNITEIAVTVQYLPDVIRDYFGDGSEFGVNLHYFEETEPLGTAGSVRNASSFLDETFIVISGDALTDFNLDDAVAFHQERESIATIVLTEVDTPLEYGVVMTNQEGRITRFLEKPNWSEVFSDTVNTGIYILEPDIFELIPAQQVYDFSMQLFPLLLEKHAPLYGYIAEGYWSDIGNLQQYRETQFDMLDRKVQVHIAADEIAPGIFVENHTTLTDRVTYIGPVYIGAHSIISPGAVIGEYSIIGSSNQILQGTHIDRTILWDNNQIGPDCELQSALVCDRNLIGQRTRMQENAVIGSGCTLGPEVTVKSNVKLWPNKVILPSSKVHTSIIWGEQTMHQLFRGKGVYGIPNSEMTPEFAGKLAAAFGSILSPTTTVGLCSSTHPFASMMKIAFAAGLQAAGIHVLDLGAGTTAVCRNSVQTMQLNGAVHMRMIDVQGQDHLLIELLDSQGLPLAKSLERKIENAFWQEDFIRGHVNQIGEYRQYNYAETDYMQKLVRDLSAIAVLPHPVFAVLQYDPHDHGSFIERFASLILGHRIILHHNGTKGYEEELIDTVMQTNADFGIHLGRNGQGLHLVLRDGTRISDEQLLALKILATSKLKKSYSLGVPVSAPQVVESLVLDTPLSLVRTKENNRALLESSRGFLFNPLLDDIYAVSLIIQAMMTESITLEELISQIPYFYTAKEVIPCAWHEKGSMMRQILKATKHQATELIDGIKVMTEEGWVIILPDHDEPLFRVIAHASSETNAERMISNYCNQLVRTNSPLRK